jgi:dTDP-D-glucose 4,6-dehydratase
MTVLNAFTYAEHDHVVHFAAESHVDRSLASPAEFVTTNDTGLTALLLRVRPALAVSAARTGTTGAVAC